MLPKKQRLHHASDIQSLLRHGRRIKVDCFFLFTKKRVGGGCARGTIIVGKKFSPQAVVRNRQKRILREVLRDLLKETTQSDPYDTIIMCTNKGKMLSYKDAKASFLQAFRRNIDRRKV